MFELWVVWRYIAGRRGQFFNLITCLAIAGMALGIAALVVVMGVVSGFETTLREAVIDLTGHVLVLKRGEPLDPMETLEPRLKRLVPEIVSTAPFVHVEGMVAHKGKIAGIVVEGFDPGQPEKSLDLRHRLIKGEYNLGTGAEAVPPIVIGRGLSDKLRIEVGEEITVVQPKNSPTAKIVGFVTRLKKFRVSGIVDLGKYEYDTRFLLTSAKAAQDLGGLGPVYSGVRLKLTHEDMAQAASFTLSTELGPNYLSRDWLESNHNLFQAIKLEKVVIFIVLLFMTVAACFNISSTLFVSVLRRYGDISVLKTLGATHGRLMRFFSIQGMIIGLIGSVSGLLLGVGLCEIIQNTDLIYVPAEIYHLRRLPMQLRIGDLALIFGASFVLCLISTWAPARRGARLNPVEGLRHE